MGRPKKDQLDTVSFTPFITACLRLHLPGETISFTVEMLLCSLLGTTRSKKGQCSQFHLELEIWAHIELNASRLEQVRA